MDTLAATARLAGPDAAEADAALIDGHFKACRKLKNAVAAEADAALIDGHPSAGWWMLASTSTPEPDAALSRTIPHIHYAPPHAPDR
jgi:hypothetical protein